MLGVECHALPTCILREPTYVTALPDILYYNVFVTESITWHIRN